MSSWQKIAVISGEDFHPNSTTGAYFFRLDSTPNSQKLPNCEPLRDNQVYKGLPPNSRPNATRSIPQKIPGFPSYPSNPSVVHELQRIPADLFVERRLNRQKKHRDSVRRISHGNEIRVLRGSGYLGVIVSWVISIHFLGTFF